MTHVVLETRPWWIVTLLACVLAAFTTTASAQSKPVTKPPAKPPAKPAAKPAQAKRTTAGKPAARTGPSTLTGIYTDEQALRGKYVYIGACRSCHSPTSHTGATFEQWWRGKQLSDLFSFIGQKMPKNDPGTLAPEDVADVVAYLLKMNAMPVGKDELYPDADSLKQFRIELKSSSGTSTVKRTKP